SDVKRRGAATDRLTERQENKRFDLFGNVRLLRIGSKADDFRIGGEESDAPPDDFLPQTEALGKALVHDRDRRRPDRIRFVEIAAGEDADAERLEEVG